MAPFMRVLQVITDTNRRGAQVFAVDLGAALTVAGHDVDTVALVAGTNDELLDVEVLGTARFGAATLRALRRRAGRADVVIAHGSNTLPACAMALLGARTPFVYRQISDSLFWAGSPLRRWRVRAGLQRAAAVVTLAASSGDVLTSHFGVPPAKITVVPNGVPGAEFAPASADRRRAARSALGLPAELPAALFLGALVPEKGADIAVDALSQLSGVSLIVSGDGVDRAELERSAAQRLAGRVLFTGSVVDVGPVLAAADLVVFPSRGGDSMPATLIEAGLSGLPSVATRVGAIDEIIIDGVTGVLIDEAVTDEFTAAISALLDDPAAREAMGGKARSHCLDRFEIGVVADGWLQVLRSVAR